METAVERTNRIIESEIEIAEKVRTGGRAPPRLPPLREGKRRGEAGVAPKGRIETTESLKKPFIC
jgi:hypothetical protein